MNEALLSGEQISLVTSYMNYLLLSTLLCLILDLSIFKDNPLSRFEMASASLLAAAAATTFIGAFSFDSLVVEMSIAVSVSLLTSLATALLVRRLKTLFL